jgi:hypothetical protein
LLLSLSAHRQVRSLSLTKVGLAPNIFPMYGVRTLDGLVHGLVVDELFPTDGMTSGPIVPPPDAAADGAFLDLLGIRYVLLQPDEPLGHGLRDHGLVPGGLRLAENLDAWPEAVFAASLPHGPVPRKAGCGHDRFLCADFAQAGVIRVAGQIDVDRDFDRVTIRFAPAPESRMVLLTYWYRPDWRVSAGRAEVFRAVEQFIGLRIPPGETSVTLNYFPRLRGTVFVASVAIQLVVAVACGLLWRRTRQGPAPTR